MGWIKESISWAHFVAVLRESVSELRKSVSQNATDIHNLRQQNQFLLQQLVQQNNEVQRLERKLESIEAYLRSPRPKSMTIDSLSPQPKISAQEAARDET